jgi:hypothetical protein
MQIAIIGWGSLIWCPGSLQIKTLWHRNGPSLPVEYARISSDGRLTLVIHPASESQTTLWALASPQDIGEARENLREREGTISRLVHSGTTAGEFSEGTPDVVRDAIAKWLAAHPNIEACIWTGLTSNWKEMRKCGFSVADALGYLKELTEAARAREYIQNTPGQIQTALRIAIREHLKWHDAELAPALFAAD